MNAITTQACYQAAVEQLQAAAPTATGVLAHAALGWFAGASRAS